MKKISILVQHHAGPTGDVLIAKNAGGSWEFPQGTVRTNETEQEAAERVAWEVLGIKVTAGKLITIGHKRPQDGTVEHIYCGNITHNTHTKCDYHVYYEAVNKWQTAPKSDVYTEFKYVHPSQLGQYEFEGDDANFMAKYDAYVNPSAIPDVRMY